MRSIVVVLLAALAPLLAAEKPNVIVIMADDLGYGDISANGATALKTPNIDRLAAEGLRFTSGYCSASTCTPTRYSFLTGSYAFRRKGTGVAPPNGHLVVPPDTLTIADIAKAAGYKTAVIGKWHLGLGAEGKGPDWNGVIAPGPRELGFDYNFLLPTTNDRVPQVYVENDRVLNLDPKDPLWVGDKKPDGDHPTGQSHRATLKMDWSHGHNATIHNGISRIGFYTGGKTARFRDEDLGDKWIEKANTWIEAHRAQPFFLFFASHDLHVPRMPHERFHGATKLGFRGDSIAEFDWSVGELMKTLDRLGLAEKTLVVLCSDNGPVMDDGYKDGALEQRGDHRAGGPFRGGKYSVYEGGTRTPFITRWKGRIQPGVSHEMVSTIDLAASLAALTGTALPADACGDSIDVSGALLGKPGAKGREHTVQQDNGGTGNFGFRVGNWKLVRYETKFANNEIVEQPLQRTAQLQFQLFDLAKDPGEQTDVFAKNPEVGENLKARLAAIVAATRSR
ncbi:MAG: arylsulfatase [Opitutia bacterium]|nr:arylsulfatase [Opitutaceae bacterium]PHX72933.1 MAG: arylsulfatase [Opitutae bacterium]